MKGDGVGQGYLEGVLVRDMVQGSEGTAIYPPHLCMVCSRRKYMRWVYVFARMGQRSKSV